MWNPNNSKIIMAEDDLETKAFCISQARNQTLYSLQQNMETYDSKSKDGMSCPMNCRMNAL